MYLLFVWFISLPSLCIEYQETVILEQGVDGLEGTRGQGTGGREF